MLQGRGAGWVRRGVFGVLVLLPLAGGLGPTRPAAAAPILAGSSALGSGGLSSLGEYATLAVVATGDQQGDVEVVDVQFLPDACWALTEPVAQPDIDAALHGDPPPEEPGVWMYEVCAADQATAHDLAAAHPTAADARRYCGPPYAGQDPCDVFVRWRPDVPAPPDPAEIDGRWGYFKSLFSYEPSLRTSPAPDEEHGLIANFPTWFWNAVDTRIPKGLPFGSAWHQETTFDTDGHLACSRKGLHRVGTVYRRGHDQPGRPSPSNCGYTYPHQGRYEVRGCTTWLFVTAFPFRATFCSTDVLVVKEVQVLGDRDPRRHEL